MQVWQDHVALGTNQFLKYGLLAPQAGRVLVLLKAVLVAQVVDPQALAFPARCIDLPKAPRWSGASPCRLLHSCAEPLQQGFCLAQSWRNTWDKACLECMEEVSGCGECSFTSSWRTNATSESYMMTQPGLQSHSAPSLRLSRA